MESGLLLIASRLNNGHRAYCVYTHPILNCKIIRFYPQANIIIICLSANCKDKPYVLIVFYLIQIASVPLEPFLRYYNPIYGSDKRIAAKHIK